MCNVGKKIKQRKSTHYGLYHDIGIILEKISTQDLIQYFIEEFGENVLRNFIEEQIIANEINKERYGGHQ